MVVRVARFAMLVGLQKVVQLLQRYHYVGCVRLVRVAQSSARIVVTRV